MTARRLLMPLTFIAMAVLGGSAAGQGAFPAPSPDGPPAAVVPPDPARCRADIAQLLQDLREHAAMIEVARGRKLGPRETCDLYKRHVDAGAKLVSDAQTRFTACGIRTDMMEQLKANGKAKSDLMERLCAAGNKQWPFDRSSPRPDEPPPDQRPFRVLRVMEVLPAP